MFFLGLTVLLSCGGNSADHIIIETSLGKIEVLLYPDKAPKTVKAFLSYIDSGFYEKSSFYRILSTGNQPMGSNAAELIQGGIYRTKNTRDYLKGIPHEPTSLTGLTHKHGTISLARLEVGTANTEFFICIGENPGFDAGGKSSSDGLGYAAFGQVIKGMDVVMQIYNRPEQDQEFSPPIVIFNIKRK